MRLSKAVHPGPKNAASTSMGVQRSQEARLRLAAIAVALLVAAASLVAVPPEPTSAETGSTAGAVRVGGEVGLWSFVGGEWGQCC